MKVLVIGAGAIGSFYGSLLAKAGAEVSVVARSDYEPVKANGIEIRSEKLGDYHFRPAAVFRRAAEMKDKPDYVLLCIKLVEGIDRAGLIRDALGPHTAIVLICNGVEVEDEIARAFPAHELISCLAFVGVSRAAPGKIWHQSGGRLTMGGYPGGGVSGKMKMLCEAYGKSGIEAVMSGDILASRWDKAVWNAPFNPLSVLSGGLTVDRILSAQEALVRALMAEVCTIAAACGHPTHPDIVETMIKSSRQLIYKTSMLLDFEAGRPMETEAILGAAVRAARRAGVACPRLETVYALMKLLELKLAGDKKAS